MKNNEQYEEDNTYSGEGMLYRVIVSALFGVLLIKLTDTTYYLPICIPVGMVIGLTIGSSIKKSKGE